MSAQPPLPPNPPQPGAAYPPPAPPRSNSVLLWVLVGIGTVLIFGVFAALMVVRAVVRSHINVTKDGNNVVIQTSQGTLSVNSAPPTDLGLPIYPGATALKSGATVEFTGANDQRSGVSAAKYVTSDSMQQVQAWYAGRLGPSFEQDGPGPKTVNVRGIDVHVETGDIAFTSDSNDAIRVIALKPLFGRVQIDFARIGRAPTQ